MCPRRFRWIPVLLASTLLLLPGTASAQKKEELPHPATLEELRKAMKDVLDKNHVPGAGAALVSKGELLWCGGVGLADVAAKREVNCDTEFRVGSISKTFVALALLKLQEEGRINLYARLSDVAPEVPVKNKWDTASPVRIVNLLEHSAGFDDMSFSEVYNRKDPPDTPLLKVFQAHPGQQTVRWPPGSRFSYSNPGYGVAGYLIERVTGQPYDAYIQQNILAPIGFTRGDFRLNKENESLLAQGYEDNPPRAIPYKHIYLRPAGDLKASPGELAKLVQLFLLRGRAGEAQLVKPESIARIEYPETITSAKHGLRLGYGLANYTSVEGGVVTHGHDGGIDGFISSYRYMPEQNWGYVVLLNSTVSGKALRDLNRLAIDFLSRNFAKPRQPVISAGADELKQLAGYYASRAPRNQILSFLDELQGGVVIRLENGNLTRSGLFGGEHEILLPVGRNVFRGDKDPEGSSVFFQEPDGSLVFVNASRGSPSYAVRESIFWPCAEIGLLAATALVMASAVPYGLFWLALLFIGRLKDTRHLRVRAAPLLAVLSLGTAIFGFSKAAGELGLLNFWSVVVYLATILLLVFSVLGLIFALLVPKNEIRPSVRIYSLLVAAACCVITAFFSAWHLIGLRLWAP